MMLVVVSLITAGILAWFLTRDEEIPSSNSSSVQAVDHLSSSDVSISGSVGVLNCESAGPGCNTLTLTEENGKQWELQITETQRRAMSQYKHLEVHGKLIAGSNSNNNSIQVNSFEPID